MSCDTAKENASIVDSSATEWSHNMGNSDDPDTPSYKHKEDNHHVRAEKSGYDVVENSPVKKNGKCNTRYFIIKSLNHHNLQLSIEKGIWATQVMNEPILEEAFHNSGKVILIFSVNMSGFFQGYAQMMSSVGWRRDNIWNQGSGKNNPWGRSFKIKWLRLNDLPFQKTLHLRNPLNDFKPVKISRDCQELPEDIGEALCELIDGESDDDGMLRRPCVEPPCTSSEEYNALPHPSPWAWTHMPYPSFLYQHPTEASRFLGNQGLGGTCPENLPASSGTSKVAKTKHCRMNGNISNLQVNCDIPSQLDIWGLPAESPLASTLTDDDFLEMTYEEYLQVHSRSIKQLNSPAAGPSQMAKDWQRSKSRDNDSNSSDRSSRKRPQNSSEEKMNALRTS